MTAENGSDPLSGQIEIRFIGGVCEITVSVGVAIFSVFDSLDVISGIDCDTFDVTVNNDLDASNFSAYYTGGSVRVKIIECNCSACPASKTLTVSGLTGACGTYLNGTYTLDRNGTRCEYLHNASPSKFRMAYGGDNSYRVVVTYSDGTTATSTAIGNTLGGCPVNGTYVVGFQLGGDCSIQAALIVIS